MKRVIVGVCLALVLTLGVSVALAGGNKPGNSTNAGGKVCQKGQWEGLVRSDGTEFTSQDECTAYVKSGGTVFTDAQAAACLGGGYASKATANGDPFNDAAACANYMTSNPDSLVRCTVVGTSGDDFLGLTGNADVVCGFGGDDTLGSSQSARYGLDAPDLFYGGAGNDDVGPGGITAAGSVRGTFYGNDGDDTVTEVVYGTFEGGDGNDAVGNTIDAAGTFNGGPGNDYGGSTVYGVFNGGTGNDSIFRIEADGTFNGGDGNDSVTDLNTDGFFSGGNGDDHAENVETEATFNGEAGNDTVTDLEGVFDGGADTDTVTNCLLGGTTTNVEINPCA